ncbi:MAG: hypothetical protein JW751_17400 [Polyangiaceae bacterium]|nr:hypothetical protein [Polyangiaceae bacterium]
MSAARPFAYDSTVVLCWSCGAPVTATPAGSNGACSACGGAAPTRPRNQVLPSPQGRSPGPQDPMLRAQDGRPLTAPPGIAFLFEGGSIPAHRQHEALMAWQGARRRAANGDGSAGEEIVMLARELANAAEQGGDRLRARAVLESSLEVAPFPRHRATLLGALARGAVRAGDVDSAFRWWQHFDGGAPDLESDSEWRVSTAVVATARGDYMTALTALGANFEQYAIQDALDPQAVLFRANALEKTGQLAAAKAQLQQILASGGPTVRAGFERMVAFYGPLALCAGTMNEVVAQREKAGAATAGLGKILLGLFLIGVPFIPALIGVGFGIAMLLSGEDIPLGVELMPVVMPIGMSFVFFLAFGVWGIKSVLAGLRERRAFRSGVRTTARVLGARPTGVTINDIPEMLIELEVALDPPVKSALRRVVHPAEMHALVPGAVLNVRVDPKDPSTAILDQ